METGIRVLFILVLPLIVDILPLVGLLIITRQAWVAQSKLALLVSTISSLLSCFPCTYLAFLMSSRAMVANGAICVTGAVIFLLLGGLCMLVTLITGISLNIRS